MRILAIDGALNKSGWVILDDKGGHGWDGVKVSKYGIIKVKSTMALGFKLHYLHTQALELYNRFKPDVVVLEDTYAGPNVKTNARLNNAKGVFIMTFAGLLKCETVYVTAAEARSCLGFKNVKDDAFNFFKGKYNLKEDFLKGNDITDSYAIGWWYIKSNRNECLEAKTKTKKKRARKKKPK